jgi:tetratricopeptide (TPR) repeat protein
MYLGDAYSGLGEYQKSKELLEQALETNEKCYGKKHTETSKMLMYLGKAYEGLDNPQEAMACYEQAYEVFTAHNHPLALMAKKSIEGLANSNTFTKEATDKAKPIADVQTLPEKTRKTEA